MSVIIRLQNLPWSANALDIRQFFRGLSIPEGGVHIVGGEQGDAFIAFSTDEDARQGMMLDGGKIKEVKIRLLLSSRTEMQKVIEQARQQSVTLQTFMQMPAPPMAPLPSVPSMPSMMAQQMSQPHPSMPPAIPQSPVVNSSIPVTAAPVVAEVAPVPVLPDRREQELKDRESDNVSVTSNKDRKDRRERSRSRDKDGERRNKRERDRSRGRRDRDRDRNRRHRDRSNSRDRDRSDRNRRRDRRDRSRSRDRSHSRDRNSRDRERDPKRNSRDHRRDSSSIPKEEKDIEDSSDMVAIPKLQNPQPLLLPHLKMQQQLQQQLQQQQQQQQQSLPLPLQNNPIPFTHMQQHAKTPTQMHPMGSAAIRAATPGTLLSNAPTTPGKLLDIGGHGRWDLPVTPHVMGNVQGGFKPLPAISQGVRPLQPSLDAGHLREIDNRHNLSGVSFPSEVLRPSLPSVGHDIAQTPFMKTEGFRDVNNRENILLRGQENWQASPSRQGPEGNNRFPRNDRGAGFSNPQDSFNNEEYDDNNKIADFDYPSHRGNFRGSMRGMGDFRRGFLGRGRGLGPNANRGFPPNSHNETDRRNMPAFSSDRRGQPKMFGRQGRTDPNAFNKDRFENFDRSHSNDRQFSGRGENFANERYHPGGYTNDRSYDNRQKNVGTSVEIRNMPSEARYFDIKRFFHGLPIGGRGIKLINDNHGNRVGIAYVRFFKHEHKEQALTFSGKPMCGSPVEVLHLSDEIFDKAIDSFNPHEEIDDGKVKDSLETFVCLTVHDIPVYTKDDDLNKLFHDFGVDEIILLMPNDKKQNVAYVKFKKPEDAKRAARTLMKPTIGHKLVTIMPCSLDHYQHAKKLRQEKRPFDSQERVPAPATENAVVNKAPADPRQREADPRQREADPRQREADPRQREADPRQREADPPRQRETDPPRQRDTDTRLRDTDTRQRDTDNRQRDTDTRQRDTDARQRDADARQRDTDPRQRNTDPRQPEADLRKREADTRQREADTRKREADTRQREADPRQREADPRQREADPRQRETDPRQREADPRLRETPMDISRPEAIKPLLINTDCILLKGLPNNANDRDILDFFSDIGLVPLRIHIMLDKFNKPTGDAFCEFSSVEEAVRAVTKHQMPLGKENVSVEALPRAEMHEALGMVMPQPEPLMQHPIIPGPRFQPPQSVRNPLGTRSVGLLGASPNAPNRMALFGRHAHVHPGPPTQPQDVPVEGFGRPGCVIALENVPFRADVDEILNFFQGFDITRENIIRRFNDKGMPTGDARVALSSPADVQRAVHTLRYRLIGDRQIFLRPL